jgi:hypothetical protein
MHICAKCNIEVAYPEALIPGLPDYRRNECPVCPCGRLLHSPIVGPLRPAPLWLSFVRAFLLSFVCLSISIVVDLDLNQRHFLGFPDLMVKVALAVCGLWGLLAFALAWSWAGSEGPVRRLAARAAGTAFGFLWPALLVIDVVIYGPLAWLRPLLARHLQPFFL